MTKLRDISISLSMDPSKLTRGASEASAALNKMLGPLKGVYGNLETVEKRAKSTGDSLEKSFKSGVGTVNAIRSAVGTLTAAFEGLFTAAAEGARNDSARKFFEQSGKSLNDLREATRGMIADADLMKKANLADSMGISTDTFKVLAKVAQASALKTGQSFDFMFNSIIVGTARASRLLLDNLGIIVSVEEANNNYAKSQLRLAGDTSITTAEINKFVKAMDDDAKKVAFADEVKRKSTGTMIEFGKAGADASVKFDQFSASMQNLADVAKDQLAKAFAQPLPTMTTMIDKLADIISGLDKLNANDVFKALMTGQLAMLLNPAAGLAGIAGSIGGSAGDRAKEDRNSAAAALDSSLMNLDEVLFEVGVSGITAVEALSEFGNNISGLVGQVGDDKVAAGMLKSALVQAINANRDTGNLIPLKDKPKGGAGGSGTVDPESKKTMRQSLEGSDYWKIMQQYAQNARDEGKRILKEQSEAGKAAARALNERTEADIKIEKAAQKWIDDLEEGEQSWDKLQSETKRLAEAETAAAKSLTQLALDINKERDRAIGSAVAGIAGGQGIAGPIAGSVNAALPDQGFGAGIGGAVTGAMAGAGMGAAAGPLGAIVGALVPVIADIIDGLKPVGEILGYIGTGLGGLIKNALEPLLQSIVPIFQGLVPVLSALGNVVGMLIDPFVDLIRTAAVMVGGFLGIIGAGLTAISPLFGLINVVFQVLDVFILFLNPLEMAGVYLTSFIQRMVAGSVAFANGITRMIRLVPGLGDFGKILKVSDILGEEKDEATEDNTKATKANTQAVRDLTREFRNLPQNYKVNDTIFRSQDPRSTANDQVVGTGGILGRNNQRIRT